MWKIQEELVKPHNCRPESQPLYKCRGQANSRRTSLGKMDLIASCARPLRLEPNPSADRLLAAFDKVAHPACYIEFRVDSRFKLVHYNATRAFNWHMDVRYKEDDPLISPDKIVDALEEVACAGNLSQLGSDLERLRRIAIRAGASPGTRLEAALRAALWIRAPELALLEARGRIKEHVLPVFIAEARGIRLRLINSVEA